MKKIILMALLASIGLFPNSALAEKFENMNCYAGTYRIFSMDQKSPPIMSWVVDGLIVETNGKRNDKPPTFHCEGVTRGMGPARTGHGFCTVKYPDGDLLFIEEEYTGVTKKGTFLGGTGKYQKAKGSYKADAAVMGKPVMPNTMTACGRSEGEISL